MINIHGISDYQPPAQTITRLPKVLFLDIETRFATLELQTYQLKQYSPYLPYKSVKEPVKIVCVAWKWEGDSTVQSYSVVKDKERFNSDPSDDISVLYVIKELLEQADVMIAHNGDNFDLKMIRTRLVENNLSPANEPKTIDTLKLCRNRFRFLSNSLGYAAMTLGLDVEKGTPPSWEDVHKGEPDIVRECERYCRQDVRVLEKVYNKIKPYRANGVNMGVFVEGVEEYHKCPSCASLDVIRRGFSYTNLGKFQRFECKSCGAFSRGSKNFNKNELLKY